MSALAQSLDLIAHVVQGRHQTELLRSCPDQVPVDAPTRFGIALPADKPCCTLDVSGNWLLGLHVLSSEETLLDHI